MPLRWGGGGGEGGGQGWQPRLPRGGGAWPLQGTAGTRFSSPWLGNLGQDTLLPVHPSLGVLLGQSGPVAWGPDAQPDFRPPLRRGAGRGEGDCPRGL